MSWLLFLIYSHVFSIVNKQINDKERVSAALENPNLQKLVENCIKDDEWTKCVWKVLPDKFSNEITMLLVSMGIVEKN